MSIAPDPWDRTDRRLLLALGLMGLVAGILLGTHYGMSYDAYFDFHYAEDALRAYRGSGAFLDHGDHHLFGPAHMMFATVLSRGLTQVGWLEADGRHLANFLTLVAALLAFYYLARQALPRAGGLAATLLFATQPLFIGQSFVNQKDIPFMAWFVLSVALGHLVLDRIASGPKSGGRNKAGERGRWRDLWQSFREDWGSGSKLWRTATVLGGALLAGLTWELLFGGHLLAALEQVLAVAYEGQAPAPIQVPFDRIAEDAYKTPLPLYEEKLNLVFGWTRVVLIAVLAVAWIAGVSSRAPQFVSAWRQNYPRALVVLALAGLSLGIVTSIRVAGPLAGVLVIGLWFWKIGVDALPLIPVYFVTASVAGFLTWPYLWSAPIDRFLQVAAEMSGRPSHTVLYEGIKLPSHQLPWHYPFKMTMIRLTEPAAILALIGLLMFVWARIRRENMPGLYLIGLLWSGIPLLAVATGLTTIYGNIRHIYFALPPLFLFAGLASQGVFDLLPSRSWIILLIVLLLLPGLASSAFLHPYEQSYFNRFVGGTSGAYGQYAVDPWCTSYRETMEYVNRVAPPEAEVGVRSTMETARVFAREDLALRAIITGRETPDYALLCRVDLYGDDIMTDYETVFEVRRGEAILARVKRRPSIGGDS